MRPTRADRADTWPARRVSDLRVEEASVDDAATMCELIHAAFNARPRLDPPTTAFSETVGSVAATLERHGGLLCKVEGVAAGALLFTDGGSGALGFRRLAVSPPCQSRGIASAMVSVGEDVAAGRGCDDVVLRARSALPATVSFWRRRGYGEVARKGAHLTLAKALPVEVPARSADDSRTVGERIAGLVQAGDVVILTGTLGAGKTTLTQGIATGLHVRGLATSPTFVIARVHPSTADGPALVHVDAYRLGGSLELDDLDLDAALHESVTVIEWGEGVAEGLSPHPLRVEIVRRRGGDDVSDSAESELRQIIITPVGTRWVGAGVRTWLARATEPVAAR